MYNVNELLNKIIKENDIRGKYGKTLTPEIVGIIARAVIEHFKPRSIFVGRDVRYGSDVLANEIIDVAKHYAIVYDLGVVTTPMFYFASFSFNLDLGFMITASHNPPEWNGIKILWKNKNIGKEELTQINFEPYFSILQKPKTDFIVKQFNIELIKHYYHYLKLIFEKLSNELIVDTFHGTGYLDVDMLERLNVIVHALHYQPDELFGGLTPNPEIESNLEELRAKVFEKNLIGVGIDGDADRVRVIDEIGTILESDVVAALLIAYYNFQDVVATVTVSNVIKELKEKMNFNLHITKVGRKFVKNAMTENGCDFGFEHSGHFYFKEFNYFDSALFTILKILELMRTHYPLAKLVDAFKVYKKISYKIEMQERMQFMEFLKSKISNYESIDGIRKDLDDAWFLIRPSNTEPVLRVYIEAKSEEKIKKIKEQINQWVNEFNKQI